MGEAEQANQKQDGATILRDVYVRIVMAEGLRDADWNGKTDPVALAEIPDKPESRIISPAIINTQTPKWYHQQLLKGCAIGDEVVVSIWDDDPGSTQPEDGDFLGQVTIKWDDFYPKGMDMTELQLVEQGKDGKGGNPVHGGAGKIKIEIVTQDYGFVPPPFSAPALEIEQADTEK